ncbi:MAG: hypothetical protein FJ304_19460 [Planctomycetes bacterium]|nr:hypothetical protein [Planctomycetota bacterium]
MLATLALASALSAPSAEPAPPAPRYYFLLFAQQSVPFVPRTSHTYATYVKATPTADGKSAVEQVTISWLPAEGPVEPLRLRSSPGKNFSLEETFAIAAKDRARVSMWGPFEIDATRYDLAVAQVRALDSGAVRFRTLDSLGRNRSVSHCVHAVTYTDPNLQWLRQPVLKVGEPGTAKLAIKYAESGAFLSTETHDWLLPVLGLDKQPVVRRALGEVVPRQWR